MPRGYVLSACHTMRACPLIADAVWSMAAIIHIFGVGSALLILSDRAMREPLAVGWVTGTDSHVFAIYDKHKSKLRKRCALGVGRHKKLSIMNKFLLSLMSFLMMTMCVCSFTACSSDDDDDDDNGKSGVETPVYTDASDAVVGEYKGDISISGYTGTVPTTVTLTKRTSTMVNMIMDSDAADVHTSSMALNVESNNGTYTISDKNNIVRGTVSGRSLSLTMNTGNGSLMFSGLR